MSVLSLIMAGTLPAREMANVSDMITTIPTPRVVQIFSNIGNESVRTAAPDWGALLLNLIGVYYDSIGIAAYVIIFAIPFVMMWIGNSDMTLPAIIGMLFSLYCFAFLPSQYILFALGCFVLCIAALAWSLYRRGY